MIYDSYLSIAEAQRWNLDTDIAWDGIDPALALQNTALLDRLRDSALIESFFPIFTPRVLDLLWDNVEATAVFSVQLYESYKHFHVFNLYLYRVSYRPIDAPEIVELRRGRLDLRYTDPARLLTRYMMSEHFAAHHFFKDAKQSPEPVLSTILKLVARDELRHCQFAYDLLDGHLNRVPGDADKVLDEARHFRHIGLEILPQVPMAEQNDFASIVTMNHKLKRLTGRGVESVHE